MKNDDTVSANLIELSRLSQLLGRINNDFDYIEGVVSSRLELPHYPPSEQNIQSSSKYSCAILHELEDQLSTKLMHLDEFEEKIYANNRNIWLDILIKVMPRLRGEILSCIQKRLSKVESPSLPVWSDILPEPFSAQVLPLFRSKQYLSAVRRGCDALRAIIRSKTGLHHYDGSDLINQAYGKDRSFEVEVWEGHSSENIQRGYADMLRGAMTGIRNPHYHGTEEISEQEAARLLALLGTLWARASSTKERSEAIE